MRNKYLYLNRENMVGAEHGQYFRAGNYNYMLQGKLGDGAIGIVRKARNLDTEREVAIKFLAPDTKYIETGALEDIFRRFRREGIRGSDLFDENIVEVFAFEENAGGSNFYDGTPPYPQNPFILMEYAGKKTLENYIKRPKGMPQKTYHITPETLFIAHEISKALLYLHNRKLVHRDLKPANIFVTKKNPLKVKLGDFGIVKWGDFKASVTTGTLTTVGQKGLGTLKYMAHEQSLEPKEVTVKADMFGLGITLFELFTNQILPDVIHVFQIQQVRQAKNSVDGRMRSLGLPMNFDMQDKYGYMFEVILDMFRRPSGRPSSKKVEGMFRTLYERAKDVPEYHFK